jgi:hypothetical protein
VGELHSPTLLQKCRREGARRREVTDPHNWAVVGVVNLKTARTQGRSLRNGCSCAPTFHPCIPRLSVSGPNERHSVNRLAKLTHALPHQECY